MSEKFKKALRIAVNVGCGFEGDAEDAAELLTLITGLESRIAELEGELAELKERFDITDGLLNQATVSIGAVIACCTYNSNAEAMAGAYGISYRAFTMIDNFIKNYNRAVLDGKASTDVKNIICWPPNPQEVQE